MPKDVNYAILEENIQRKRDVEGRMWSREGSEGAVLVKVNVRSGRAAEVGLQLVPVMARQ
jgi:hypothetical protein